ncbi:MAG TPA: hypothetical protein VFE51_15515 [Verrucomicrobiae bacterium]|nr:hypothetical protein [Verrucomicrobiae bacterium]
MKYTLILFALSLSVTACTTTTSDTAIRRQIVGLWSLDSHPGKVVENKSDGTIVVRTDGVETARGTWQIKDGYIVDGIGSSTVESNKIVSVSGDKVVVLSIDGHTQLTFNKQ